MYVLFIKAREFMYVSLKPLSLAKMYGVLLWKLLNLRVKPNISVKLKSFNELKIHKIVKTNLSDKLKTFYGIIPNF